MLHFGRKIRGLSRLMVGLFAVQVLVAGFCLLTPEAHASGMVSGKMQSMHMHDGVSHCEESSDGSQATTGHGGHDAPCAHCDLPDELIQKISFDHSADIALPMLALVMMLDVGNAPQSIMIAELAPTGPPGSASLLYTTTQRIRI